MAKKDTTEIECNAIETWVARDGDGVLGIMAGVLLMLPFWASVAWWLL